MWTCSWSCIAAKANYGGSDYSNFHMLSWSPTLADSCGILLTNSMTKHGVTTTTIQPRFWARVSQDTPNERPANRPRCTHTCTCEQVVCNTPVAQVSPNSHTHV